MNTFFYKVWLPLKLLTAIFLLLFLFDYTTINWWIVFVSWFLLGPIGIGVGFHKLFSHRQFETYKPIEYIIAVLGTLASYAPILYFASQHQHHHTNADGSKDVQAGTKHGIIESFWTWRLKTSCLRAVSLKNYPVKRMAQDKFLMFLNNNFVYIIWATVFVLLLADYNLLLSLFLLPILIEEILLNSVNTVCHFKNLPFNYRNYETDDSSSNNVILGLITLGRGWHNNHHANSKDVLNWNRWWELDIEGLTGLVLSKSFWQKKVINT